MNKIKELKIDSTLWAKIINSKIKIINFKNN